MPRTNSPSPSPPPRGVKREASSDYEPVSDVDVKPRKGRGKGGGGKAPPRVWTGDELDALFTIALAVGPSRVNFEGKIAGRTGLQCLKTWEMAREKGVKK